MSELPFHKNSPNTTPTRLVLPILQKLVSTYKVWQIYLRNFPKDLRYTLGTKIDLLFIETAEALYIAAHLTKEQKIPYLKKAGLKLDLLKFFLCVAWESKAFDSKKYAELSEHLEHIGKQIGGWQKEVMRKINPA